MEVQDWREMKKKKKMKEKEMTKQILIPMDQSKF